MTSVLQRWQNASEERCCLPLESLTLGKLNVRRETDDLDELSSSVTRHGILHPLVVRRSGETRFEVVAGSRRFRVAQRLGLETVPAVVVDATDKECYEISLVENIQRRTLNPLEEAKAFLAYIRSREEKGLGYGSVTELASRIGKSQAYVSNRLGLLRLPEPVLQRLFKQDSFTVSHAEGLAAISDNKEAVATLSELVVTHRISVRELERAVRLVKDGIEIDSAVELGKIETRFRVSGDSDEPSTDRLVSLLDRSKSMLERVLRYVDNVTRELPDDSPVRSYWVSYVRRPIHESIDGVIRSKKMVRHPITNRRNST